MSTVNELLLMSKNDIPFPEAQLTIHQPSIKQIGYLGQEDFFLGCQFLTINKNKIQDSQEIENASDFDIFMSIAHDKNPVSRRNRTCAQMVLLLLFPQYKANFLPRGIGFIDTSGDKPKVLQIDQNSFSKFQDILKQMFCLDLIFGANQEYNPADERAKKLAQKFKKYHQKLAKQKGKEEGQDSSIFSRYISILAVGQNKSINTLLDYSVYQLMNQFRRYQSKQAFDIYIEAKMAGAKDLDEVDNWMGDLDHPDKNS